MTYINPRSKLMRHMDRLAALQSGRKEAPVNVEIDLSNRCSLGCDWCHFAYTHTRGPHARARTVATGDFMDTNLAYCLMDELAQMGVCSITWSGGGEPTLHPDFDKIVGACPLPQGLYTNGQHITRERAKLLRQRMEWVYVSLDAADGKAYARDKGVSPPQFQTVCTNVRQLVGTKGSATVGLGFLLGPTNWQDARLMYSLGRSLGVGYIQFRPTVLYDPEHPGAPAVDRRWLDLVWDTLSELQALRGVEVDLTRFEMLRTWTGHNYDQCWWSALQSVVTPDGRVWACLNKRGYDGACLGDLNTVSFEAIWNRAPVQVVNDRCRVMCRGHIPNLTLVPLLSKNGQHEEFI